MLQQTRASVVIPYYLNFLKKFPTPEALAQADEQEILAAWSGLGYYSRVRNLQHATRQIVEMGGFPTDYEGIRSLKGVGDYTAAAVGSIAFDLPYAVLDGNVIRVTSRLTNDASDVAHGKTKQRLQAVANQLLDPKRPGLFNQAMMELGATLCIPRSPQCLLCPVSGFCEGRKAGRATELPVKLKKGSPVTEEKSVFIIHKKGHIFLWKRPADSRRLAGFWELPEDVPQKSLKEVREVGSFRHTIVNHCYTVTVVSGRVSSSWKPDSSQGEWVAEESLQNIPLSTTSKKALHLFNKGG